MLSRKTLGVAGAAILGSVALLATNTASAVINLDTGAGGVTVAKETLLDNEVTTVSDVTYYNVGATAGNLNIAVKQGISLPTNATVFYRFELGNMVFTADSAIASGTLTSSNSSAPTMALVAGGTVNTNFAVYSVGEAGLAADTLTLAVADISVRSDAAGSVKLMIYRESLDATIGAGSTLLPPVMVAEAVRVVDGLEESGSSRESVADVETGFTKFTGTSSSSASIGGVQIRPTPGVALQSGQAITSTNQLVGDSDDSVTGDNNVDVTFKGDFSEHMFTVSLMRDCTGTAVASALNAAKTELVAQPNLEDDSVMDTFYLCIQVAEKNTMPLPTGDYMATVAYGDLANAKFGRADQTVTIGSIGRDGTTVYIPYLVTDDRYNQRIVIVNRASKDADYSMTFTSEDGIMADPGMAASGTLAANSTTVLRTADVVTITGGPPHRASGMMSIVSTPGNISVATNQTTKMGGSTDTVVYESM